MESISLFTLPMPKGLWVIYLTAATTSLYMFGNRTYCRTSTSLFNLRFQFTFSPTEAIADRGIFVIAHMTHLLHTLHHCEATCEHMTTILKRMPDLQARVRLLQLLRDCADICSLTAKCIARHSAFSKAITCRLVGSPRALNVS